MVQPVSQFGTAAVELLVCNHNENRYSFQILPRFSKVQQMDVLYEVIKTASCITVSHHIRPIIEYPECLCTFVADGQLSGVWNIPRVIIFGCIADSTL